MIILSLCLKGNGTKCCSWKLKWKLNVILKADVNELTVGKNFMWFFNIYFLLSFYVFYFILFLHYCLSLEHFERFNFNKMYFIIYQPRFCISISHKRKGWPFLGGSRKITNFHFNLFSIFRFPLLNYYLTIKLLNYLSIIIITDYFVIK